MPWVFEHECPGITPRRGSVWPVQICEFMNLLVRIRTCDERHTSCVSTVCTNLDGSVGHGSTAMLRAIRLCLEAAGLDHISKRKLTICRSNASTFVTE